MRSNNIKLFIAGVSFLSITSTSFAQEQSYPLISNLKNLRINGAVSGFFMHTFDRKSNSDITTVSSLSSAHIQISYAPSINNPVGFTLDFGKRAVPTVGIEFEPFISDSDFDIQSAYIELNSGNFNLIAGKIPAIYGWEPPYTYKNLNVQRGLVWWAEYNSFFNGFRLTYSAHDRLKLSVGANDWSTKDGKYALELGLQSKPLDDLLVNFTVIYNNKYDDYPIRLYSLAVNYTIGNTSITLNPDLITVPDSPTGTNGNGTGTGFGTALFIEHKFTQNISSGLRIEYVKADKKFDYYGIGANNSAITSTLTAKYNYSNLFVRGELSYVKTKDKVYENGRKDNQARVVLEAGFIF
ncbi:outer membrane beta-barrel protein [Hydrogenobacter sp. T-2]|uniref:outer membrane beta-barrel protein n=1 Tax=Pampinifervens diazotrophicum TaxID=1632018 RepID=UPI002B25B7A4|nr:outer membrane beta-barrel protein [Hydrogenobacter sp. T-2]WPM31272.1 outer membrane beta-barrel protein [Hydrogenobacter sp. T-2]